MVLIDITTLTYFHEQLGKKATSLNILIDKYLNYTKLDYDSDGIPQLKSMKQMIPFSAFVNHYIREVRQIRTSQWLIQTIYPVIL